MNDKIKETILQQLDQLIADIDRVAKNDTEEKVTEITIRAAQAISRLSPTNSFYIKQIDYTIKRYTISNKYILPEVKGILKALRADYDANFLLTITQLIQADLFADFLEMAEHLQNEGYKDPAAVITGSVLEEHLRKLCQKNGLPVEDTKPNGNIIPKKANQLNQDLAGANVLTTLDQKSVTTWLAIRNSAAHGKYSEYTKEQVSLMIQGVQDFLSRNPA